MWFAISVYSPAKEHFVALFDVITDRKQAEETRQASYRFLQIAYSHTDIPKLLEEFTREIKNYTGCAAVGIRILDEAGNIPYQAYDGFSRSFFERESPLSIKSDECMCINVIKGDTDPRLPFYTEGGSFYMNGTTRFLATVSEEEKGQTRNVCNEVGYESVALVPIRLKERMLGLIHVADPREGMVPLKTVELLEKEGMQLGTAILRRQAEEEVQRLNAELEKRVVERTNQLEATNKELEAFSYSVSHDLRAPLRSIDGFSLALLEDYIDRLDETGKDYFRRIRSATQRMSELIDGLLILSRLTRAEMKRETVDLSGMTKHLSVELQNRQPDRPVEFVIAEGVTAQGDAVMLRVALQNLLGNAWKFTRKHPTARIEFGVMEGDGQEATDKRQTIFYVRDDGAGFDMAYSDKLFGAFQRLHANVDFPGIGIGLTTVRRIIHRHGGRIWAEGEVEKGATFFFTLP